MTGEKINVRTVEAGAVRSLSVDELVITLPNGVEFSLLPGDRDENEVVALISAGGRLTIGRFVLRPGAANQVGISAERLPASHRID